MLTSPQSGGGLRLPSGPQFFANAFVVCVVLTMAVGSIAAMGLLAAGMAMFVSQPVASSNFLLRYWYILALPFYCMATSLWSLYPSLSLRSGLQLLLTLVFSILVVRHLSIRQLRRVLLYTLCVLVVLSLGSSNYNPYSGALVGLFGSKNALSAASAVLILTAVLQMLDTRETGAHRLGAAFAVLAGIVCLVMAKSAGAWVLVPTVLSLVWMAYGLSHSAPLARVVHITVFLLSLATAVSFVLMNLSEITYFVLDVLQKDITLTGRTLLWDQAISLIEERPWFGHGYKAFWVQGYGPAETLWREFGIEARSGFHFHNLYLSNAVELGVVGVALQVGILYVAFFVNLFMAVRTRSTSMLLFVALVGMSILQSMIEVPAFSAFDFRSSLACMALVYGVERARAQRAHLRADPSIGPVSWAGGGDYAYTT